MTIVVAVFIIVYVGMMLGGLPGLKLDRSAIALVGAIVLLATGEISRQEANASINFSTINMLFGLMIVSANFDLAGLYSALSDRVGSMTIGPKQFLAVVIVLSGAMSAFLTNDVVAVALAPMLLGLCINRKLNPLPFLLALACSANAGSIATIIGSPQNILIAQHFNLSFVGFMGYTAVPAIVSLALVWAVIAWQYRGAWQLSADVKAIPPKHRDFDRWEAMKGAVVTVVLVGLFVFTDWPRDLVALAAGGLLLANAHFSSHKMLHRVDWQLLILFVGLFVVNGAMQQTHLPQAWIADLKAGGLDLADPAIAYVVTAVLSDVVSNVPSIMLLLPFAGEPRLGPIMAVASGLSSNLIVIGSLASIIVVDQAARGGLADLVLGFRAHRNPDHPILDAAGRRLALDLGLGAGRHWCVLSAPRLSANKNDL